MSDRDSHFLGAPRLYPERIDENSPTLQRRGRTRLQNRKSRRRVLRIRNGKILILLGEMAVREFSVNLPFILFRGPVRSAAVTIPMETACGQVARLEQVLVARPPSRPAV